MIQIAHVPRNAPAALWFTQMVKKHHYLRRIPDDRTSYELYSIRLGRQPAGVLLFGRPEATRCADWYGDVEDVESGKCEVTRWQILNLSRVWISSTLQAGGHGHKPGAVPGYVDRKGVFRSTLASDSLVAALGLVGFDYLIRRPPCFLDEPYEIKWVLSYCNTKLHKGTIYKAAGFELYRTNEHGIQTWRKRVPALTAEQDVVVRRGSELNPRARQHRARRAQLSLL